MTRLVFIHGRGPAGLDADELESVWLAALHAGFDAAGSDLRLTDDDASFVYYGDTLDALVRGETPPPVTVHVVGNGTEARLSDMSLPEAAFALAVAREILSGAGADVPAGAQSLVGDAVLELLADALATIDRLLPGLGGAVVLLLARDVYAYLHDDEVRAALDAGLAAAMPDDEPAIVVAHSLGTIVAYQMLRRAAEPGWDVPLFLTLASPLAIRAIRDVLAAEAPLRVPTPVGRWVDARDPLDLLAVHGLTPEAFPLEPGSPAIEQLVVDNRAPGHHGAAELVDGMPVGYLAEAPVALVVADALGESDASGPPLREVVP